jgi:hypothetical protein
LQEQFTQAVKQQYVYGTMHQSLGMDFSTTSYPDDFVVGVDDIEQFIAD